MDWGIILIPHPLIPSTIIASLVGFPQIYLIAKVFPPPFIVIFPSSPEGEKLIGIDKKDFLYYQLYNGDI